MKVSSMWKLFLPLHSVKCPSLLEVSQYRCSSSCMDLIGPRQSHLAFRLAELLGRPCKSGRWVHVILGSCSLPPCPRLGWLTMMWSVTGAISKPEMEETQGRGTVYLLYVTNVKLCTRNRPSAYAWHIQIFQMCQNHNCQFHITPSSIAITL